MIKRKEDYRCQNDLTEKVADIMASNSGENGLKAINGKRILRKAGDQDELVQLITHYMDHVAELVATNSKDADDSLTSLISAYRTILVTIGDKMSKLPALDVSLFRRDSIGDESWTNTCLAGYYRLIAVMLVALAGYEDAVNTHATIRDSQSEAEAETETKKESDPIGEIINEFFDRIKAFKQGRR